LSSALRSEISAVLPQDLPNREDVVEKTAQHAAEMLAINEVMNLTSIKEPRDVAIKHVLDSLAPWRLFERSESLLDIGSGGGFPGIPLAVVYPEKLFILCDSTRKKAAFIADVVERLELTNVAVFGERGETVLQEESVDTVFGRAVGSAAKIFRFLAPAADRFERLVLYKGPAAAEECADAAEQTAELGLEGRVTLSYELPDGEGSRTILEYRRHWGH